MLWTVGARWCTTVHMPETTLSETIKVRVLPEWKTQLAKQALREGLDISDIARRAINEFIKRNLRRKI